MSSAVLRLQGSNPVSENRRTIAWLAFIFVLVSLLTSEALWTRLLAITDTQDGQFSQIDPLAAIPDSEKELLTELTENPDLAGTLAPTDAIERNAAIPFAHSQIASAKPFLTTDLSDGAARTALLCLTQAVYYEAGFEPLAGRQAVAQVVLNRAMHPAFPKSVCGVVYQGVNRRVCQFSFTCDGSLNRRPSPAAWLEAEAVARAALNGRVESSVGYSTHYHANYVSPYWAPKLVKIARIGAHIFYRWPGGWGMPGAFNGRQSGNEAIPAILPRSLMAKRNADGGVQPRMLAEAGLAPDPVLDNHADADIGGRLDVSKGWTANIPEPEETRLSSRIIARQQAGEYEVSAKGGGS